MCKYRTLQYMLVVVLILGSFSRIYGSDTQTHVKLSAIQLNQDLDFLFQQLENVHPNVCEYITEERFAKIQKYLQKQF